MLNQISRRMLEISFRFIAKKSDFPSVDNSV